MASNPISPFATAAEVEAALRALPNIGGLTADANVAVTKTSNTFVVAFVGGPLAHKDDIPLLEWADFNPNHLIAQDQEQTFQILNATTGDFKLKFQLDLNGDGKFQAGEQATTDPIAYPALTTDIQNALGKLALTSGSLTLSLLNKVAVSKVGTT
ncbi:MAG: hypothetical protein E6J28_13135, partial [Chloroflexi bacterium]